MTTKMTSNKSYLIHALYDWIIDNNCTPYIVVQANLKGVEVPFDYVDENSQQIIFDISPHASRGLSIDKRRIAFTAKFSGQVMNIKIPIGAILSIYAQENHRGMEFELEPTEIIEDPIVNTDTGIINKSNRKKPFLTLIKNEHNDIHDK